MDAPMPSQGLWVLHHGTPPIGLFFLLSALVAILLLVVISRDSAPDPEGLRPRSLYLPGVLLISLFAAVIGLWRAAAGFATALLGEQALSPVGVPPTFPDGSAQTPAPGVSHLFGDPAGWEARRAAVVLVVAVVAWLIFRTH